MKIYLCFNTFGWTCRNELTPSCLVFLFSALEICFIFALLKIQPYRIDLWNYSSPMKPGMKIHANYLWKTFSNKGFFYALKSISFSPMLHGIGLPTFQMLATLAQMVAKYTKDYLCFNTIGWTCRNELTSTSSEYLCFLFENIFIFVLLKIQPYPSRLYSVPKENESW